MASEPIFPLGRVTIMGVLNLTPDSFSDGGRLVGAAGGDGDDINVDAVLHEARALVTAGAHVLDVGGESTRPGARTVSDRCEIARTRPAIKALVDTLDVPISIDTRKARVAEAALQCGASIVNDVSGLGHDPELAAVCAAGGATLIVGHMRGTPATMQDDVCFDDALSEVARELEASLDRARSAGLSEDQLAADPGIGFGKRLEDNLQLIAHSGWLRDRLGVPLLVGPSRKSFLGALTGDPVEARDQATIAACAVAAFTGVDAVRVHDAGGARRAVAVGRAMREARRKELS